MRQRLGNRTRNGAKDAHETKLPDGDVFMAGPNSVVMEEGPGARHIGKSSVTSRLY